jgi:REP element-mobilizing transposase RayT
MRRYQVGAYTKTDLKVHLIWIPKDRKRALTGPVAVSAGCVAPDRGRARERHYYGEGG